MSRAAAAAEVKAARRAKARIAARRPESLAHAGTKAVSDQSGSTGLASVTISPTLNCTVQTNVDSTASFYGGDACATLVAVDGTMYGPNSISAGPSYGNLTPVSQTTTGSGTSADPYVVTTVVGLSGTSITLTETDTWAVGASSFSTDVHLDNGDSSGHAIEVYRAGDCYLADSDQGFGEIAGLAGLPTGAAACQSAWNQAVPANRMMEWIPNTPGNTYIETDWPDIWSVVGNGTDLPDSCMCTSFVDNGMALAWSATLGAGASSDYNSTLQFNDDAPGSAPGPGEQGVAGNETEHNTTCYAKEPVNCATGDFVHQFTDFSIPGRGVPLSLQRTYSSAAASTDSPFGFGWTGSYNMSLSVDGSGDATVSQEDGSTVTFLPDGSGGFTAPPRVLATLVQNTDGTYTFTRQQTQVQYVFSATGQLMSEVDLNGYTTTLAYDGSGRLSTVTDPAGRSLTFGYTGSSDHVATVTDPMGRVFSYSYDGSGNLAKVSDPLGRTWSFTYDPNHLLLTMTDPRGGTTTNVYDSSDRVVSQTDAAGHKTTWAYSGDPASSAGGTTTMTDPHGNKTVYSYENLELMAVTHGAGTAEAATTSYTYDPATLGQQTITDPNGNVTTNTYDANGNLLTTTDPLGDTTYYSYDSLNDVTSVQSPEGEVTGYGYDGSGNLLNVTDPDGNVTTYTYGDSSHPGDVTSITDPDGRVTSYTYDANGDRTSAEVQPTSAVTDTTKWVYDADGEVVCQASANATANGVACPAAGGSRVAGTTTTSYDADGEATSVTDPNGNTTRYVYDGDGNRTSVTDPSGNVVTTSYDPDNRPTKVTAGANGSSPSATTSAYDLSPGSGACQASVTGVTYCTTTTDPGGNVTVDYYDARDQLIEQAAPGGLVTRYGYDLTGNRTSKTSPSGQVTSYGYDKDNHLASIGYSDGVTPSVGYSYDADGRRAQMTDGTGTTTYSYDLASRLTQVIDGNGNTVAYNYDGRGDITGLSYPNGQTVTRTFNGAAQLVSIQDWLGHTTAFSYDHDGNLTGTTYPDGDTVTSSFDPADQLTATQVAATGGGTPLAAISYTRNNDGLITQEADSGAITGTTNYSYDAKNEVTAAGTAQYGYDLSGNPTGFGGTTQAFNAADELTTATTGAGTASYGYDANGELTGGTQPSGAVTGYAYDEAGNLTSVAIPAPQVSAISPGSGPAGTKVTITGSGFTGATAVKFGSAAATFTVTSDGQITATAPAGSGAVDITVTTAIGTSAKVAADQFSYGSVPAVTGVSPAAGPAAGGTSVTITGTGFTGATAVHFGANKATTFTVASNTSISATAPAGSGTVDVTVTAPAGTSPVTPADQYTYTSGPVVTKVSPTAGRKAGGTAVTVTGTGFTGATAVKFGTKNATTFTVNSATSISATSPAGTGTVDVTVTTPGGTSPKVAADRFSYLPRPTVTKISPTTGPTAGGTKVTVTGTGFTAATAVKFGTKKATTFTVSSATSISATSPAGTGTVNVTVTTPGGTSAAVTADRFTYAAAASATVRRAAANGPTVTATYTYNGDGLRMSKATPGHSNTFAWDTSGSVPLLLNGGANNFIYGPGNLPIEQISTSGTASYFFHDAMGSTRVLLTSAGAVGATFTYSPYGALTATTGTLTTPITYDGAYRDTETGLYYLIHRYYDPQIGRFLTIDPAISWSLAAYGYAAGDPLNQVDPLGLFPWHTVVHDVGTGVAVVGLAATVVVVCAATCGIDATVVGGATVVVGGAALVGATIDSGSAVVDCIHSRDKTCAEDIGGVALDAATHGGGRVLKGAYRDAFDVAAGVASVAYSLVTGESGEVQSGSADYPLAACQSGALLQPSISGDSLQGGSPTLQGGPASLLQ